MGKCKIDGRKCLGQSWYCVLRKKARLARNSLCSNFEREK